MSLRTAIDFFRDIKSKNQQAAIRWNLSGSTPMHDAIRNN